MEAGMAGGVVASGGAMMRSSVWLAWVAANIIPSFVVSALVLVVRDALGLDRSVVVAYVVLFGLVATLQARVRAWWLGGLAPTRGTRPGRWVATTLVALVVAMFFGVGIVATLDGLGHEHLGLIAGWAVAGGVLGGAQAATLGAASTWKWVWTAASVTSWVIAAATYSRIAAAGSDLTRTPLVRWLVGGLAVEGNIELGITALTFAVYGALTGLVLVFLTPGRVVAR